jgi:hypothetical protein
MAIGLALLVSAYPVFDAVIVDLQLGEQAGLILDEVHLPPSNRTAVTVAISGSAAEDTAFRKRSQFVFERPFSGESIRNTLKPAYGLIPRERRRYFRCPISMPVVIPRRTMAEISCQSLNISEGGMAVSTLVPLIVGEEAQVQFTLPGHETPFSAESKVCWWRTGHLGVHFMSLSQAQKSELQGWLSQRFQQILPEVVAGKFRKQPRKAFQDEAEAGYTNG